jgi:hypothetical protein
MKKKLFISPHKFIPCMNNICSDSRAAIAALTKTTSKSSLEWESMKVLEKVI